MAEDIERFQVVCPECSEVFPLDYKCIDIDPEWECVDMQCPVCGHEQNITRI